MNILSDRFFDILIEKAKVFGLFLILLLVPICYTSGDIRKFQETTMVVAGMAYASLFFGSIWITLFFLLNIGLFIWNGCAVGSGQVVNIFIACILFTASRSFFQKRSMDILVNSFKILVLLNLSWMILQLCRIDPLFLRQDSLGVIQWGQPFMMPSGFFNYQAAIGMFFSLAMPFFFSFSTILPLLLLIPICLASSSACYLSGAVMAIYGIFYIRLFTFKRKIIYWLLFICIAFAGIFGIYRDFSIDKLTGNSRFENWHLYVKMSLNHPLFGHGPDSFRNTTIHKNYTFASDEDYNPLIMESMPDGNFLAKYYSADEGKRIDRFKGRVPKSFAEWREAHNEYIQVFFEYGLLGLILIGFFLYEIFRRFRLSTDSKEVRVLFGAILCYLAFSTTQFPFHLARIVIFLPIILGAFFAYTDKDWDIFVKGGV